MSESDRPDEGLDRRLRGKVALAALVVAVERLWLALAPAAAVLAVFLILSLLGAWRWLPGWLHALGLGLFALAFAGAIWSGLARYRRVRRDDALARLERDSALDHAPLRGLDDALAAEGSDPATVALWRAHRERLRANVAAVRLTPPRSALPTVDPWAVRALLVLLLAVGLVDAEGRIGERLRDALLPGIARAEPPRPIQAELWITPPTYTRAAPFQAAAGPEAVAVPAGSEALVQLHHLPADTTAAELRLGDRAGAFSRLGAASAEARLVIDASGRLVARTESGRELGGWEITAIADSAPSIAFREPPSATHRGVLRLAWDALDDHGIAEISVRLLPGEGAPGDGELFRLSRPADQPKRTQSSGYLDLTPHPLAGLRARLVLEARDALGQVGTSEPVELTLPERQFTDPLARLVIEARRQLAQDPADREAVADMLSRLAETPQTLERGAAAPLALESAAERLRRMAPSDDLRPVQDQLWDTALLLEEGQLSLAERQLREADQALRDALERDADLAELERLLDELQQAMSQYLDELSRRAAEQGQQRPQARMQQDQAQSVRRQDLQEMLDRAREMLRSGQRDALQQMLSQLRDTLENLQAQAQGEPSPEEQTIGRLQDLIQRQQELMDQSFQMDRQGGEPGQQGEQGESGQQQGQQGAMPRQGGPGQAPGMAGRQEQLRRDLGQLMQELGEAGLSLPRGLGQAELEMRAARDRLSEGSPGAAAQRQGQAIDMMQQAGRAMLDELRQMMGERPGQQGEQAQGQPRRGRDPLGRSQANDGGADLDNVEVPDEAQLGRARDVLEELFRRSAQPNRPRQELDYYQRLLDRF